MALGSLPQTTLFTGYLNAEPLLSQGGVGGSRCSCWLKHCPSDLELSSGCRQLDRLCVIPWVVASLSQKITHSKEQPLSLSHLPFTLVSTGVLTAGEHNFPFQFLLPGKMKKSDRRPFPVSLGFCISFQFRNRPDSALSSFLSLSTPASAPTSFEGPFGKVLHQVKAVIDTPRFSKDYKCNKIFYVLCPLNLNDIPDIEVRTRRGVAGKCQHFSTCPCPAV